MCRPHCWQYAKPTGVGVPQRGHVTICCPAGLGAEPAAVGGIMPGAVDGGAPITGDICGAIVLASCPPEGIPIGGAPYGGAPIGGAPYGGGCIIGDDPTMPIAPPEGGGAP